MLALQAGDDESDPVVAGRIAVGRVLMQRFPQSIIILDKKGMNAVRLPHISLHPHTLKYTGRVHAWLTVNTITNSYTTSPATAPYPSSTPSSPSPSLTPPTRTPFPHSPSHQNHNHTTSSTHPTPTAIPPSTTPPPRATSNASANSSTPAPTPPPKTPHLGHH